jgi:superfamily I DNA and/or RNA helicase
MPLLVRSSKAIIVGDPLQIEPIITLSNQRRENYRKTAFLDKGLTELDYHNFQDNPCYYSCSEWCLLRWRRAERRSLMR